MVMLALVAGVVVAAVGFAALLALVWVVAHAGVWLAAHHPGVLVLVVFLFLVSGIGSSRDGVLDRLGAIHTTLLMRR